MTFKEVEKQFYNKYPEGTIYKESTYNMANRYEVSFTKNGKVYPYRCKNLTALLIALKLKEKKVYIEKEYTLEELKADDKFGLFADM